VPNGKETAKKKKFERNWIKGLYNKNSGQGYTEIKTKRKQIKLT
jgi:hypothetical protein